MNIFNKRKCPCPKHKCTRETIDKDVLCDLCFSGKCFTINPEKKDDEEYVYSCDCGDCSCSDETVTETCQNCKAGNHLKEYRVTKQYVVPAYNNIEARTPEEAIELAEDEGDWDFDEAEEVTSTTKAELWTEV